MHIKQIVIQGFKSYKDQTVTEPFSPKTNVIVGRNGSGKSNFFAAIRFVLSDAYTQMGKEERQALLHEGTGPAVMSAFVEIIFDNSDDRFPTGKPELILRRTIGVKKDEYSLDRKNATKSDVMNLLESAGFSRSNPYYIVPQGRVTALTNMKDGERLTLLKEVAGTQVYEARRTESLKIMAETNHKRSKIDELLKYINDRLDELEEEKDQLRDYQEKEKERKCLQYTIDRREQLAIEEELNNIDEQRQYGVENTDDSRDRFIQGEQELESLESRIAGLKQELDFLKGEKQQLEVERRDAAKEKAKIELHLDALQENQQSTEQAKSRRARELKSIQGSISQREKELAQILPDFATRQGEESRIKAELEAAESTQQRLYAKQGRNARFRNKKERDDWLRREINDAYPQITKIKAVKLQTTEEIADLGQQIGASEDRVAHLREQIENRGSNNEAIQTQMQDRKTEKGKLNDERQEMWREDARLDGTLVNLEKELSQAERDLSHRMDSNTSRGLAAVRRIKKQHDLEGVYGTLAELMEVPSSYRTAVEVTAGNSLFHYVVDNDETATKVLEILQKERSGRITFMPLNRLKPRTGNIPRAADAVPMLEKIKYDSHYERAFEQVFGQTIICPNLPVAAQYARSHGVSAITIEGDRSDRKGALTGGYHDPRQSRLEAVRKVTELRHEYETKKDQSRDLKKTIDRKSQEITLVLGEIRKLEQGIHRQEGGYGPLRQELQSEISSLQSRNDSLDSRKRALANINTNMKALTDQQSAHEAELSTDFKKALTQDEETQLERLIVSIRDLRLEYAEATSQRSELESQKSTLEIELRESLRPRLERLNAQAYEDGEAEGSSSLKEAQANYKQIERKVTRVETRVGDLETKMDETSSTIQEHEQRRSKARLELEELAKHIERQQKHMERSIQKKAILTKSMTEVSGRIRDLGVLPQDAFTKYERVKSKQVGTRLKAVNEELKKYGGVNKKAFQQYESFTNQRETLTKRRAELDESQGSIEELIAVLDQRKDEAIERTFKQVSREFAAVFETLVPAGRGRLIIQRKTDQRQTGDESDSDGEEAAARRASVENYTGVGISVSFNSKHDDQQRIQQLSGGQKSLCALTLIFAIQRCDPAPFYLFDEIDANLDAQYRTAVARMLQTIANARDGDGQFICTTFRPEMLRVAEKCYGVRYVGKSSTVGAVSREDAMEFVQGEGQQGGGDAVPAQD